MIDGTEKPKIPQKFAKCAARYNEFGSNWREDKGKNGSLIKQNMQTKSENTRRAKCPLRLDKFIRTICMLTARFT